MSGILITLPDGSQREFKNPITGLDVANNIGEGLANAALAIKLNGQLVDLSHKIEKSADVEIITRKSEEALELIRHDAAHVMAEAVQELFPGTQVTIGPAIENGFYYDFARDEPFGLDDLDKIESKMRQIIDRNDDFVREEWSRDKAIKYFSGLGE